MRHPFIPLLIAAALTGSCTSIALAQELPSGVRACAAEADASIRLACYDRQIPPLKPAAATAPVVRAESAAPAAAAPVRHITSIAGRPRSPREYTLDNGEVWRQVDNAFFLVDVGDAVTVQRGPVGGLWLQTDARHGTRVTRVH